MSKKKTIDFDFENALAELNDIVESMENGDLSLEESLKQFEKGILLTRQCQKALQEAEQKVKILMQNNQVEKLEKYKEDLNE